MKGQVNLRGKGCSSLIENRTQDTSSEVLSHYAGRLYSLRGQRHSAGMLSLRLDNHRGSGEADDGDVVAGDEGHGR